MSTVPTRPDPDDIPEDVTVGVATVAARFLAMSGWPAARLGEHNAERAKRAARALIDALLVPPPPAPKRGRDGAFTTDGPLLGR